MSKLFTTKKLKEYREAKQYTQLEMCSLLGIELDKNIALSTYQKWEQGTLNVTPDMALGLSRFTRIPLNELIERK